MKQRRIINNVNFVRGCDPRLTDQNELWETFRKQVELFRQYDLPYTFLFQYDSMVQPSYTDLVTKDPDPNCEIGVWIELAQEQVEKCGIKWNGRPGFAWDWHVNPGFLMAYPLYERKLLIDELFGRFHEIFGFYPKSVGSWLLDTYSIRYMTEEYGVDAFIVCKDQHGTDGYTLWGGYYNQAYYPSKENMFMPAKTPGMQINAPVIRMLGSDPIYQYAFSADEHYNPAALQHVSSLEPVYSYAGGNPDWVDWYFKNNFGEEALTWSYTQTGQENSFRWSGFGAGLSMQMPKILEGVKDGRWEVLTMGDTGRWFKETFKETPASAVVCMDDCKNEGRQAFWYDCKNYRTSFITENGRVRIRDIFLFDENLPERYWDKVATGNTAIYDCLPIVDGYRWSGNDVLSAIEFVAPGTDTLLPGRILEVGNDGPDVLTATYTAGDQTVKVRCDLDGITLTADNSVDLLFNFNNTADDTEIVAIDTDKITYTHEKVNYALTVKGANITGKPGKIRIAAIGNTVELKPILL